MSRKGFCFAKANGCADKLPVKLPKREKRVEPRTVFLLECDGAFAVCKREAKGLLAGLWQLPNTDGALSPEAALETVSGFGAEPIELLKETHKVHIFTHIRWEMVGYHILCKEKCDRFLWATPKNSKAPMPCRRRFDFFRRGLNHI